VRKVVFEMKLFLLILIRGWLLHLLDLHRDLLKLLLVEVEHLTEIKELFALAALGFTMD
jgi:hypothetical protein